MEEKRTGGGGQGGAGARPEGGEGEGGGAVWRVRLPASSACVCRPPCSALPPPGVTGRPPRRCTERETGGGEKGAETREDGSGGGVRGVRARARQRGGGVLRPPLAHPTPLAHTSPPTRLSLRPHRSAPGGGRAAGAVAPRACATRPRTASPCAQPSSTGPCEAGLPRCTGTRTTGGGWSRSVRARAGSGGGGA